MDENNRKGPGIFYAVTGVATLVVAIIGATFAYFSATATSEEGDIEGQTAAVGLELTVTKVSASNAGLIPLTNTHMNQALAGTTKTIDGLNLENNRCVDDNGNTVCQIYSVNIENTGTSTVVLTGTGVLNAKDATSGFDALKWQKLDTTSTEGTVPETLTLETVNGTSAIAYSATEIPAGSYTEFVEDVSLGANSSITYFIVVWIENAADSPQEDENHGTFTGTIKFNSADGSGVSSTFTS